MPPVKQKRTYYKSSEVVNVDVELLSLLTWVLA